MKHAFTLIELSIVLIIIGLLVGGVLAGRDLIRQAELRAVNTDMESYRTAINVFRLKYGDGIWPGDWDEATSYFSGTGNGGGNGLVTGTEMWRFWQHLALAGLIPGQYTGAAGPISSADSVPGVNTPEVPISGGEIAARYIDASSSTGGRFAGIYPNHIIYGSNEATYGFPDEGLLNAREMQMIDAKMDDGIPGAGSFVAENECTDADDSQDFAAEYDLSDEDYLCSFHIILEGVFEPAPAS